MEADITSNFYFYFHFLQPNFGDGEIISPPSITPVAIFDQHSPPDDSPPSHNTPATSERYSGVGEYTVENHHRNSQSYDGQDNEGLFSHQSSSRPRISGQEDDYFKSTNTNQSESEHLENEQHSYQENGRYSDAGFSECDVTLDQEAPPYGGQQRLAHQRIADLVADAEANKSGSGTKTPPLQISAIATAIADASSTTNADDLAAMIMAFSNKQRDKLKGKSAKSEDNKKLESKGDFIDGMFMGKKEEERLPVKPDSCQENVMFPEIQRPSDLYKPSEKQNSSLDCDKQRSNLDCEKQIRAESKPQHKEISEQEYRQKRQDIPRQSYQLGSDNDHDLSLIPSKQVENGSRQKDRRSKSNYPLSEDHSSRSSYPPPEQVEKESTIKQKDPHRSRSNYVPSKQAGSGSAVGQKDRRSGSRSKYPPSEQVENGSTVRQKDPHRSRSSYSSSEQVGSGSTIRQKDHRSGSASRSNYPTSKQIENESAVRQKDHRSKSNHPPPEQSKFQQSNVRDDLDLDYKTKDLKSRQRFSKQEGRVVNGDGMEGTEMNLRSDKHPNIQSYQCRPSVEQAGLNEMRYRQQSKASAVRKEQEQENSDNVTLENDLLERRHKSLNRQKPSVDKTSHDNEPRNHFDSHEMANQIERSSQVSTVENTCRSGSGNRVQTSPRRFNQRDRASSRERDTSSSKFTSRSQLRNDSEPDGEATSVPSSSRQRTSRTNHMARSSQGKQPPRTTNANLQNKQASQRLNRNSAQGMDENGGVDFRCKDYVVEGGDGETVRQDKRHSKNMGLRPPANGDRDPGQLPQRQPTTGQTRLSGDRSANRRPASPSSGFDRELLHPNARQSPRRSELSSQKFLNGEDTTDDLNSNVPNDTRWSPSQKDKHKLKPSNNSGESASQSDSKSSRRSLPTLPRDSLSSAETSQSQGDTQDPDESMNTKYARQVEAIKQAIKEGKDMMSYIGSSPESDDSITSPTPSPEDTPTMKGQFSFDMKNVEKPNGKDGDVRRETRDNDVEDEVSPVVSARDSGRRTSMPSEKAADVTLNTDELDGGLNERANGQSPSLQRHPIHQPVSSFQAFPNGPHFNINPPTTTPTLLTSQSLMTTSQVSQYLNDRPIIHSRPTSSLGSHPLAASSHLGAPANLVAAAYDPQLFNGLSGSGIATSTAPYYSHMGVQPQLQHQQPVGAPFGHPAPSGSMVHLQSTYPSSGQFVQSLPSFQGLPGAPAAVPGLGSTGMLPPHLQSGEVILIFLVQNHSYCES